MTYIKQLLTVFVCILGMNVMAQTITFNGAHSLLENQDYIFTIDGTDATGRNIYTTAPIDGNQPCDGIGVCELKFAWNNINMRWELLADDGNGDFSSPYVLFTNSTATEPNPPSLLNGVWMENTSVTQGQAGGDLTDVNSTMTGDLEDPPLSNDMHDLESKIIVYPNPVEHKLFISKSSDVNVQQIHLLDLLGRTVLIKNENLSELDASGFNTGVYFLRIKTSSGQLNKKISIK